MPHEKTDIYKTLYPVVRAGLRVSFDRSVEGIENIPSEPALYAPNHILFEDSLLVAASYTEATGVPMRFGAKQEYFDGRGIDDAGKFGRPVRWLMEHARMIPVDRENINIRSFQVLQEAVARRFDNGDAVGLHPEGTRVEDDKIYKFRMGAARIALALSVPIVPVGIVYSPYDRLRRLHADVTFGTPIMPSEYNTGAFASLANRPKAERLTQLVEDYVANLTGMEQTGAFAPMRELYRLPGRTNRRK